MAKKAKVTKQPATKIRKKRQRRKKSVVRSTAQTSSPSVEAEIWMAFEKMRSLRGTAMDTGHTVNQVRQVLDRDPERIVQILEEFYQASVAEWQKKEVTAHWIIDSLLDIYRGVILEIKQATEEERLTRIKDPEGFFYTVPDAIQFVTASRMLDQVARIAQVAHGISEGSRGRGDEKNGSAAGRRPGDDPMEWPADRLVDWLRGGDKRVPKSLERKVAGLLSDSSAPTSEP